MTAEKEIKLVSRYIRKLGCTKDDATKFSIMYMRIRYGTTITDYLERVGAIKAKKK